jgi:hypothetical protein
MSARVRAPARPERVIEASLAVGIMALAVVLVAAGVRAITEDGFYYLKIAQNVAAGRGSTFDGLHPTNGYQPLWLACLVPVFWLWSSSDGAMAAATLVQAALLAAAAVLLVRLARANGLRAGAAGLAGCVWIGLSLRTGLSGVEFALTAVLLAAVALHLARSAGPEPPSLRECAVLGVLLGLSILSRLDTSLLALLVTIEWAGRARGRPGAAARIAALAAPPVVVGAVYALANAALYGSPFPVSGAAKRIWSLHLLAADPLYQRHGWLAAKAWQVTWALRHPLASAVPSLLVCAGASALLWAGGPDPLRGMLRRLRPLVLFAVLQPLTYALVYHGHYTWAPWYYVAQPLLAALLAGALAHALWPAGAPRLRVAGPAAACVVLLAGFAAAGGAPRPRGAEEPLYAAARWARDHVEPGARVGSWNAGAIGFLSGRQVVNLDGVVNTLGYLERDQYDLCAYWDRTGITYLVDVFEAREGSKAMKGTSLPVSTSYAACTDRLQILWTEPRAGNPGWPKALRITSKKDPPPGP